MADKAISELVEASQITATDMFVLEQDNTAKKLTGQVLLNWLTAAADGHGGIQNVVKIGTSGLADTYRITLADLTYFDFVVTNGRAIAAITQSSVEGLTRTYTIAFNDNSVETFQVTDGRSITSFSLTSTVGLVDTYTITYNNDTHDTLSVTNGAKGDKGDNAYIWIKYASQEPTEASNSIGDLPDAWMGVYSGIEAQAPEDWSQYRWYQIKGEKGDTGEPATLYSGVTEYQASDSGNIIPSGEWSTSIPVVAQGRYLWARTTITFNTGNPIIAYSISRFGIDGAGSVSSVAGISPNADGNVPLTAENVGALPISGGDMEGSINMNGQSLNGLNAPTEETEAATKGYVDTAKGEAQAYADQQITDRAIQNSKNLLENTAVSQTISGVTFTVNSDGSVTVNGTASTDISIALSYPCRLSPGTYTVTSGVTGNTYAVVVNGMNTDGTITYNVANTAYGNGVGTFTMNNNYTYLMVYLRFPEGTVSDNVTVYPMIRLASITDDTYEPYYKGLSALNHSVYKGSRNLLKNTAKSQTINGVTFTVNADGSVTANGTATANAVLSLPATLIEKATYTLSGCPVGGGSGSYLLQIANFGNDTGNGVTATATEQTGSNVAIFIASGQTVSNLTFYPMIRHAGDPDDTYEPHYVGLPDITPENIGALSMELLWENASPNSSFAAQSVSADFTGSTYYEIEFLAYKDNGIAATTGKIPYGYNARLQYISKGSDSMGGSYRNFLFSSKRFEIGIYAVDGFEQTDACIPIRILGYKGGST